MERPDFSDPARRQGRGWPTFAQPDRGQAGTVAGVGALLQWTCPNRRGVRLLGVNQSRAPPSDLELWKTFVKTPSTPHFPQLSDCNPEIKVIITLANQIVLSC